MYEQYQASPWNFAVNGDWNVGQLSLQRTDAVINGDFATQKFIIKDMDAMPGFTSDPDPEVDFSIPSHSNLEQVCEALTLFLKACGYHFHGYVDIVDYDDLK